MVSMANDANGISTTRLKLVICYSPFQAYVWLLISQHKSIDNTRVLYITSRDTNRDKCYVEKLRNSFEFVEYFVIKGRLWKSLPGLKRRLHNLGIEDKEIDLYLASFNTFFSMYIFNTLNINSIFLFDDGSFSIMSESDRQPYRFNVNKLNYIRKIQYKLLLVEGNDQKLLSKVSKFYTLFPASQTLVDSSLVESIQMPVIGDASNDEHDGAGHEIRVFIGDVTYEIKSDMLRDYKYLVDILPLDYYVPHPRSSNDGLFIRQEVLPDEIAEELIFRLLNRGDKVVVYSFSSTVLFTLGTHAALTKIMIKHPDSAIPSLYDLAPSNGIDVVDYNALIFSIKYEPRYDKCINTKYPSN